LSEQKLIFHSATDIASNEPTMREWKRKGQTVTLENLYHYRPLTIRYENGNATITSYIQEFYADNERVIVYTSNTRYEFLYLQDNE